MTTTAIVDDKSDYLVDDNGDYIVTQSGFIDTKELAIQKLICAQLAKITPANGFAVDMSVPNAVQRGRMMYSAESDPVPLISVNEGLRSDQNPFDADTGLFTRTQTLRVLVQGWAVEGNVISPNDPCYYLKGCAEQILSRMIAENDGFPLFPADYALTDGNPLGIVNMRIGVGIVRPAEPGLSSTAFFYLPVMVERVVDLSRPFVSF